MHLVSQERDYEICVHWTLQEWDESIYFYCRQELFLFLYSSRSTESKRFRSSLAPSLLWRSIERSQMKTKFCLEATKFNIPEMKFEAFISCTNSFKTGSAVSYFLTVHTLTGKKLSLKIFGKQKNFHVSSGSGFLVAQFIPQCVLCLFVI